MIRATLRDLATLLGLSTEEQAEDALRSERAFQMTRRGLFVATGSLVAGKAFGFGAGEWRTWESEWFVVPPYHNEGLVWTNLALHPAHFTGGYPRIVFHSIA